MASLGAQHGGRSLAVEGRGLHGAIGALRAMPGVLAAEPFGARLHVRFEEDRVDEAALRRALEGARVDRIEPVDATLEDVFLAVASVGAAPEAA